MCLARAPSSSQTQTTTLSGLLGDKVLRQCSCPDLAASLTCLQGQRKGLPQANKTAQTKLPLSTVKKTFNRIARIDLWVQDDSGRMDGRILKTANPLDLHFAAEDRDAKLGVDVAKFFGRCEILEVIEKYIFKKNVPWAQSRVLHRVR